MGEYIDNNETHERNNFSLKRLYKFTMQIKYIMEQDSFTVFSSVSNFQRILDLIKTTEASLVEYGDKTSNYATILYFILWGLDLYFEDCDYETYKISPLNDYNKDSCFIYINKSLSLMDDIIKNKTYPSIVHTNDESLLFDILERCDDDKEKAVVMAGILDFLEKKVALKVIWEQVPV